jgi:hypothetical protein
MEILMANPVDQRAVNEMAKLLRIMNGTLLDEEIQNNSRIVDASPNMIGTMSDGADDMKMIMEQIQKGISGGSQFDSVGMSDRQQPERLPGNSQPIQGKIVREIDRPLRDALVTQRTRDGVKMGSWEIKVLEDNGVKSYDVTNIHTREAIAHDLTLYESALCLCKLLNFHVGINSPAVKGILEMEESYAHHRSEAARFKHRNKQRLDAGDTARAAIAEDRYDEARSAALQVREQIIAKSKSL